MTKDEEEIRRLKSWLLDPSNGVACRIDANDKGESLLKVLDDLIASLRGVERLLLKEKAGGKRLLRKAKGKP